MRVENLEVREIADSRGEPTIEVFLTTENGAFSASIPSGKSRGSREARVLPPGEAKKIVDGELRDVLSGREFNSVSSFDDFLINLDGTEGKKKLGGNLILGLSIAFARALAASRGIELWEALRNEFFGGENAASPLIFSNLINGGVHAKNNLDIQEYMVIADTKESVGAAIGALKSIYDKLGPFIESELGVGSVPFGDEGGYSVDFPDNFAPLQILEKLISEAGIGGRFSLGLDAAASNFYKDGKYNFAGKELTTEELLKVYEGHFANSKSLFSIEDPFSEEDYIGFKALCGALRGKLVVGDDLTATNPELIEKFSRDGLINSVIIKPNQIGTLAETCQAIKMARARGVKTIVSHRSGETEDVFIIHLAKACGAFGVKIGAPKQKERLAKFDELLRLYKQ